MRFERKAQLLSIAVESAKVRLSHWRQVAAALRAPIEVKRLKRRKVNQRGQIAAEITIRGLPRECVYDLSAVRHALPMSISIKS